VPETALCGSKFRPAAIATVTSDSSIAEVRTATRNALLRLRTFGRSTGLLKQGVNVGRHVNDDVLDVVFAST
jgi:hypothetical protein